MNIFHRRRNEIKKVKSTADGSCCVIKWSMRWRSRLDHFVNPFPFLCGSGREARWQSHWLTKIYIPFFVHPIFYHFQFKSTQMRCNCENGNEIKFEQNRDKVKKNERNILNKFLVANIYFFLRHNKRNVPFKSTVFIESFRRLFFHIFHLNSFFLFDNMNIFFFAIKSCVRRLRLSHVLHSVACAAFALNDEKADFCGIRWWKT